MSTIDYVDIVHVVGRRLSDIDFHCHSRRGGSTTTAIIIIVDGVCCCCAKRHSDRSGGGGGGGGGSGGGGISTKPSKLWQRAAEANVSHGGGAGRQRGFDVTEAVYAVHGLTIQQLRERLDKTSFEGTNNEVKPTITICSWNGYCCG